MGNLYNMLFGYNPSVFLLAPMLVDENPVHAFPRFRDCYEDGGRIVVYTRVGGGNRSYEENHPHRLVGDDDEYNFHEDALYSMPTFVETYDDDFDSTYGYYVFDVPAEFKGDFDAIMDGRWGELSDEYVSRVGKCFGDDVASTIRGIDKSPQEIGMSSKPDWDGYFSKLNDSLGGR